MPSVSLSLLDSPDAHPLLDAASVYDLGHTVVLAPHPAVGTLACGGLLSALARAGAPATVVVVTDGCDSTADRTQRVLCELEAQRAVRLLGHGPRIEFLRFPGAGLPAPEEDGFEAAADRLDRIVDDLRPQTLVVPWRRDAHPDHEATWALAWARRNPAVRWIEYPVWAWADPEAAPREDEAVAWRLDVAGHLGRKGRARAAHRSWTTAGSAHLLSDARTVFEGPWELYLDPHDAA